jgi:protein-lysine N-methyltransferase EEF2KMT
MDSRLHPALFRVLCCYVHAFFLSLLDDPHFRAYPPSADFQRSWWKWAVSQLEALLRSDAADPENDEVDDDLVCS